MKKVSGSLKLTYSQYRELQSFSQFGSDLDADTKERLAKGERVVEVLKQGRNSPISVTNQVLIIFAVINNFLKEVPVNLIGEYQEDMFEFIDTMHPEIIKTLKETKDLSQELEGEISAALGEFTKKFLSEKII